MSKIDDIFRALLEINRRGQPKNPIIDITKLERKPINTGEYIDSLTGLHNEIWFEEELNRRMVDSNRLGTNLWLLIVDFDFFKTINIEYGRSSGNQVLKMFGEMVAQEEFPFARIGGEEFAQIFPKDLGLDEIQRTVSKYSLNFKDKTKELLGQEVSVSMGITKMNFGEIPSNLINRAEAAVFRSKKQGRDRSTLLEDHPITGTYVTVPYLTREQLSSNITQNSV
ncbi:MAG: PAS/PAC sensor-containing diguanylate cyclase/phosphodiesterase [Candidatus Woesebacteria bacterium GW2011_GWB1_38_5b]|uniref:PAS/PAC sensor-containing diguanylate cyclase/phosphodiesterase n=1 Tax=Candidatus Woesebacteria bacterium GW2011_GWB1_38_5b TaxID=1618569 RepID=A0A0G0K6L1_9BACT|nr:MAG: PAS/PAC sensor-containing diguanylate cyclase/phosphodiesterase [Candidatus Woesebacteria bacterium GW2011_GWB1_38_5b]